MSADLYMSYHVPDHTEHGTAKHAKGVSSNSHEKGILASQLGSSLHLHSQFCNDVQLWI